MTKTLALAAFLAVAPAAAFAHGTPPAPAHDGQVAEDSAEHWVELVLQDGTLTAYVLDENKAPVPATQLSGKATVLVGGKPQAVALKPGEGNSLTGKLTGPAPGQPGTVVLSLTVSGKPAQARFAAAK